MTSQAPRKLNPIARNLIILVGSIAAIFVVAVSLAVSVGYKPYGVPDSKREAYEQIIAEQERERELLSSPDENKRPIAQVNQRVHDFGLLEPHTTMSHTFKVTNMGADPLAVDVLGTSCKCTTGKLNNGLLNQNESTDVTLEWNTGYQDDDYQQHATIQTNDPLNREIKLTVKGTVRTDLAMPETIALPRTDPLDTARTSFIVHSQLWEDFTISDVRSDDLKEFIWTAEPTSANIAELGDAHARSAWRVQIETVAYDYGTYSGTIEVDVEPAGGAEKITRKLNAAGKVRVPIAFKSPLLDMNEGLNFGTLNSGKEHHFHIGVRVRGKQPAKLVVLDVEPKLIDAKLKPTGSEGQYRLTLTIPADCPGVLFNRKDKHGYVQVGDPENPDFMNWFPMYGGVAVLD